MSQGRASIDDPTGNYESSKPGRLLRQLLRSGQPFSGHERHCCFLNTHGARFANISALSGLDMPDDGRAIGVVDWDEDGRLDLWLVNRSGPQIRLMRNTTPMGANRHLAIKLQGVTSNRDAIGARVKLTMKGGAPASQIKTVRAGDGYLSQSSRWLHFGMGSDEQIERLTIRWPSGLTQEMTDLQANRRYLITENVHKAVMLDVRRPSVVLKPQETVEPPRTQRARIFLSTPVTIPPLVYESASGEMVSLGHAETTQRPRLINLWSRSCTACLTELRSFSAHASQLNEAGIDLIALNVDGLNLPLDTDRSPVQPMPFPEFAGFAGHATECIVDQIQLLHDVLLDLHRTLPVPTSIVLDGEARLAAIYTGPVEIDQVLADVANLTASPSQRRALALPFDGHWSAGVKSPRLLRIALEMLARDWLEETESYRHRHQAQLSRDSGYHLLLYNLGQKYSQREDHARAQPLYEEAIRRRPGFGAAHYNLGVTFAQAGQFADAAKSFSEAIAADAQDVDARLNLGRTLLRLGKFREGQASLQEAQKIAPGDAAICYELAVTYALSGTVEKAGEQYERAIDGDAKYKAPLYQAKLAQAARMTAKALETSGAEGQRTADSIRKRIAELERKWSE